MKIKNILFAIIYCFGILSLAQSTITVEQAGYYIDNVIPFPSEVNRVLDSNNVLTPFVGNWSGVHNGFLYKFEIFKQTTANPYSNVVSDNLVINYEIFDASGNLLFTSSNGLLSSMKGIFLSTKEHYYSILADPCGLNADVVIIGKYSGQSGSVTPVIDTGFDKILVYVQTIKELLNVAPANCVSISEQFPNETLFVLDRI